MVADDPITAPLDPRSVAPSVRSTHKISGCSPCRGIFRGNAHTGPAFAGTICYGHSLLTVMARAVQIGRRAVMD
jgi:hypothetical protein